MEVLFGAIVFAVLLVLLLFAISVFVSVATDREPEPMRRDLMAELCDFYTSLECILDYLEKNPVPRPAVRDAPEE